MLTPALTHGFFAIFLTSFTHTFLRLFPVVFFFLPGGLAASGRWIVIYVIHSQGVYPVLAERAARASGRDGMMTSFRLLLATMRDYPL
jgi:hypothetical protein